MNDPGDETTTEATLYETTLPQLGDSDVFPTNGSVDAAHNGYSSDSDQETNYICLTCPHKRFDSENAYLNHLQSHVQIPNVTVQRLKNWYVKKLTSRKTKQKKRKFGGIAKKRTQSYFVPHPVGGLKLTLKLAADATTRHRSFEVVPSGHQLFGPGGEVIETNGDADQAVKEEFIYTEDSSAVTVEGSSLTLVDNVEGGTEREKERLSRVPEREPDGGETLEKDSKDKPLTDEEEDIDDGANSLENNIDIDIDVKDNFSHGSPENGAKLLEEVCRETSDNLKRQGSLEEEDSGSDNESPPSPTPSEQLRPDFLAPISSPTPSEAPSEYGTSAMVELNGSTISQVPSTSPAFPTTSPAPPNEQTSSHDLSKQSEEPVPFQTASFQWGSADVSDNIPASEEHDPLQLPEPVTNPSIHVLNSDSLLRGFLGEDKHLTPTTVALNNDGHLSLGSEYIALERLGDSPHRCEVCGESANSRESLDDHRSNAGHYKCNRPECCGKVFPNSEELATHLQTTHATQYSRVMINQSLQSPPVQQLQQQVQRLPMPQSYLNQALSSNTPMVILPGHNIHQIQPQGFSQNGPPRPPVYRVPAPVSIGGPPHLTPQYANTQHMMSQMYNQQFHQQQQQQQQQGFHPQQNQQQMPQQRPNYIQQMQQMQRPQQRMPMPQRGPAPLQQIRAKRMATGPPQGTSPNAKRHAPEPHPGTKRPNPPGNSIHLTESITLSMRQPPPNISSAVTVTPISKKNDAKAVANVLASRGITVTAAGNNSPAARAAPQRQPAARPSLPPPVTTLNLNSAISIIPTGNSQSGSGAFAVPQNRSRQPQTTSVDRPPRPPTVDLTGDGPMQRSGHNAQRRMRGRPPGSSSGRFTCQICDKAFSTEESLGQHMQLHRSPNKLPFKCNLCQAQYPTQQGLIQHRQVYHKEPASGPELAIPVVDLKQPGVLNRLVGLGIVNYIPLSQLSSPQGGHFGLPIVSVDGARDPAVSNLTAMGASNILSLGPIKQLPR